jgi:Ca2+-binding RTX toxin-like protein
VLGPTYVQINGPDKFDRLRVNGRDGEDQISASTAAMRLTLDGGDGGGLLFGGPGDDVLIGGDGFDETVGGKGNDVARMRGYFDRFTWHAGDGSDDVDGGGSRDSMFLQGTNQVEVFDFFRFGHSVRFVHDPGAESIDFRRLEEVDAIALDGADVFGVRDLSGTGVQLVDISLAGNFGAPGGDNTADSVDVDGTDGDDELTLVGKKVIAGTATLTGLPYKVNMSHTEPIDSLAVHTGDGDDSIDSSALEPGVIGFQSD